MKGTDLKRIRKKLGLSVRQFGIALGYKGKNIDVQVRQMESEGKPIRIPVGRLAHMFGLHGSVPKEFLEEPADDDDMTTS